MADADVGAGHRALGVAAPASSSRPSAGPRADGSRPALLAPFVDIDVPVGGEDVVFGAAAEISSRIEAASTARAGRSRR